MVEKNVSDEAVHGAEEGNDIAQAREIQAR